MGRTYELYGIGQPLLRDLLVSWFNIYLLRVQTLHESFKLALQIMCLQYNFSSCRIIYNVTLFQNKLTENDSILTSYFYRIAVYIHILIRTFNPLLKVFSLSPA